MRNVLLTEEQYNRLFEARMDGFRLDALRGMPFQKKVAYCKQWLGFPIGNGSSRMVFQLDDDTVLKLAKNKKGIAQNEQEYDLGNDWYISHMYPKVMNGSDGENFEWIISEFVLPCKVDDFEKILGVKWDKVFDIIRWMTQGMNWTKLLTPEERENEKFMEWVYGLEDLVGNYPDLGHRDMLGLDNWGLTKDNEIKVLDSGLNEEIWNRFYRRF
jgi:hypothetical protein